jgi:hypothetical protein
MSQVLRMIKPLILKNKSNGDEIITTDEGFMKSLSKDDFWACLSKENIS